MAWERGDSARRTIATPWANGKPGETISDCCRQVVATSTGGVSKTILFGYNIV